MDLLEYQGKDLFRAAGVPTAPQGVVVTDADSARQAAEARDGAVVLKAQVAIGGRGKAGGVAVAKTPAEAEREAGRILGTDIRGHTVEAALVEGATDIAEEYYLSVLLDRVNKGYTVIASVEGGVDIETVSAETPEKVVQHTVDPTAGLSARAAADVVARAAFPEAVRAPLAELLQGLYRVFVDNDATLLEINPLVRTTGDEVLALDAKATIDDDALFRHAELSGAGATGGGHPLERRARDEGVQYVKLDGDVGVIGNGAGLVMATLDVVSDAGGAPANFLDVGGGADADAMAQSLELVLSDDDVKSVLVNIFGGITRCEEIAKGVLAALDRLGDGPEILVVRLDGTNAEEGRQILTDAAHPRVEPAEKMRTAAERAVALAAGA